ncbi:MAG: response regulator [Elusimicrobiota bacterium]
MKVLICDDEYSSRFVTKSCLDMSGYETIEASSGEEALELVDKKKPDVIIVDYSLPRMSGLDVIKKLKRKIPVIVLTSEGFIEETEKELRKYASEYLTKPVLKEQIEKAIKKITGDE